MKLSEDTKGELLLGVIVTVLIMGMIPFVYWFNHPELTEMQLFKEFWELYLGTFILGVGWQIWLYRN